MKAIGMTLIVIGHVFGSTEILFNSVSAPVYSKQLGVAFFVFIAGWGLARTQTERALCAFRRLFPILFYGGCCALLMSGLTWIEKQDLAESNYLPLFFGVNVFFNFFPANPTTWYIGMYVHLVLFWWLLMPQKPQRLFLITLLFLELITRAVLVEYNRSFTAYMMLTNWFSVFLLGYLCRDLADRRSEIGPIKGVPIPVFLGTLALLWLAALLAWRFVSLRLAFDNSMPFRLMESSLSSLWVSLLVSVVYLANTALTFGLFRFLKAPLLVRLISRNTLLIFILHMPLIYAVAEDVRNAFVDPFAARVVLVFLVLFGLTAVSELITRLLPVAKIQVQIEKHLFSAIETERKSARQG